MVKTNCVRITSAKTDRRDSISAVTLRVKHSTSYVRDWVLRVVDD